MARFQESGAKGAIRNLILQGSQELGRTDLTYLGMPAESALDIKVLGGLLSNVICLGESEESLRETERSIAMLRLTTRRFHALDMWEYLRSRYDSEPLVADVTFLDFYGGGIVKDDPFANEIAGLRAYFAKHARLANRAYVFAWTYNPRDKGKARYIDALSKQKLSLSDIALLRESEGVAARSVAIRLLLRQILSEHDFSARVYHHALYKGVMNTLIMIFAKGLDSSCGVTLSAPEDILSAPYYVYRPGEAVPELCSLLPE
jgi:hypothetical protein